MNRSVCFTGHRTIAEDKETLSARLYALLERLVTEKKVTDFYTGGAVGSCGVGHSCCPDRFETA